jgi:hypothetical protein
MNLSKRRGKDKRNTVEHFAFARVIKGSAKNEGLQGDHSDRRKLRLKQPEMTIQRRNTALNFTLFRRNTSARFTPFTAPFFRTWDGFESCARHFCFLT